MERRDIFFKVSIMWAFVDASFNFGSFKLQVCVDLSTVPLNPD